MFSIHSPQRADFSSVPEAITDSQERKTAFAVHPRNPYAE
jgi:hypothetical protein